MLRLNLPGHLSVDSVLALHEGRFGVRTTWNPAIFGWLLGVFDRIHTGTALAVVASSLLLFGSWALLPRLRPRTSWLAPLAALGVVALPQAMIYPAIVWKDVWFADAAIAGFVVLALGLRKADGCTPWPSLALAALLFAAAGLLRQNGLILVFPAALAIAWALSERGWRRSLPLAGGWIVAVAALTLLLSAVAQPHGAGRPDSAGGRGLRILQIYDLVGATSREPLPLAQIDAVNPRADDEIRATASRAYSPERVDTLGGYPKLGRTLAKLKSDVIRREWVGLVRDRPELYATVRADAFRWVFLTPDIDRCLPVHVGVSGPAAALDELHLPPRRSAGDERLYNYVTWFLDTPLYSHAAYGVLALILVGALLLRRDPADLVIAAMLAGAMAFAASFFLISIACDYRYLYFLDLAAVTGLLYLALDPRLTRR